MPVLKDNTPLCDLARKYETDKGGWHLRYGGGDSDTCHNYTPTYHLLLNSSRERTNRVLEIGVNAGSSLRMWRDYFPNANVYGLDIRKEVLFEEPRISCFFADQSNARSLEGAMEAIQLCEGQIGPVQFDLIVDDGSHEYDHQIVSMLTLLPYIKDTGFYIIEDMAYDCQPDIIARLVPEGYGWEALNTGVGIGKAHCDPNCPKCHGAEGERLLVIYRKRQ